MRLWRIAVSECGKHVEKLSRRQNAYLAAHIRRKVPEITSDQAVCAGSLSYSEKGFVVWVRKLVGPSLGPHTQSCEFNML